MSRMTLAKTIMRFSLCKENRSNSSPQNTVQTFCFRFCFMFSTFLKRGLRVHGMLSVVIKPYKNAPMIDIKSNRIKPTVCKIICAGCAKMAPINEDWYKTRAKLPLDKMHVY